MEVLAVLGQFFVGIGLFLFGLGLLLIGSAAIWFVTIYAEKNK